MLKAILQQDIAWFDEPDHATSILIGQMSMDPAKIKKVKELSVIIFCGGCIQH